MAEQQPLKHIKIEGASGSEDYISPQRGGSPSIQQRDRKQHGNKILDRIEKIKNEFETLKEKELPEGIVRDDAIYVEFISDYDIEPAFDSLHDDISFPRYQLLNIKKEYASIEGVKKERYRVNVMLTEGGISTFIEKVKQYLEENTTHGGETTEKPRNQRLVNNIETIQLATLEAFWSEPKEIKFPEEDEEVWWEVWFRRKKDVDQSKEISKIINQLKVVGAQIGEQELIFPEHFIRLIKSTPQQLSDSLMLLDNLAELRKPRENADFFKNLTISEKEEVIEELKGRTENITDYNSISICLLDSGVQNKHPLLEDYLPDNSMYSYKYELWGTYDGHPNGGHGTGMAGLSLYGDLTEVFSSQHNIQISHQLESVKIYNHKDPHEPELFGALTEESISLPIIDAPECKRIFCMAVTADEQALYGRPSSWSAAIDKITFGGEEENSQQFFVVSGGNVILEKPEDYPEKNYYESIHDPGQSFNAITVGSYTEMDRINIETFPNSYPLAHKGDMAPSNSTSTFWDNEWAVKPDIVLEGGNSAVQDGDIIDPPSLKLLTTNNDYRATYLRSFGDTSGATALASRMAALIRTEYPELWPETIRGLLIHSADWNDVMLQGENYENLEKAKKRSIIRTFGYGVPNLKKALYSARNALNLISEEYIQPFKKEDRVKYNEIHYYQLPWPKEVLENELAEKDVKLNITLSYYIEPNPGNRTYANKFSYQSHGLRFNVIKPSEDFDTFRRRLNRNERQKGESGFSGEDWIIGSQYRDKGSIHRDMWLGSGADLATRNTIAIYPVYGWYQKRPKIEKYENFVRYSLIVTIETQEVDVDIYTPVKNLVEIET